MSRTRETKYKLLPFLSSYPSYSKLLIHDQHCSSAYPYVHFKSLVHRFCHHPTHTVCSIDSFFAEPYGFSTGPATSLILLSEARLQIVQYSFAVSAPWHILHLADYNVVIGYRYTCKFLKEMCVYGGGGEWCVWRMGWGELLYHMWLLD